MDAEASQIVGHCRRCGKPFARKHGRGRPQLYCGRRCNNTANVVAYRWLQRALARTPSFTDGGGI